MDIIKPTHQLSIDGRMLNVYDNLISKTEIDLLSTSFEQSPYKKIEVARPDTSDFKHWASNIPPQQIPQLNIYRKSLEIATSINNKQYKAYRAYCNHAAYGDMLFTHVDCLANSNELTALWYICPTWDIEWGGETMFYNKDDDCVFACSPKPGRLALFDGAIKHAGRPPNRICYKSRYTLAFKLEML